MSKMSLALTAFVLANLATSPARATIDAARYAAPWSSGPRSTSGVGWPAIRSVGLSEVTVGPRWTNDLLGASDRCGAAVCGLH